MALIGVMVGLGALQVTQRNAIVLRGYAVGERLDRIHGLEADVLWLKAHVVKLVSPARLSSVEEERRLKLVARSALPPAPSDEVAGLSRSLAPRPRQAVARGLPSAARDAFLEVVPEGAKRSATD